MAPKFSWNRINKSWVVSRPYKSSFLLKDAPKCILYAYNVGMDPKLGELQKTLCELKYTPQTNLEEDIWHAILLRNQHAANLKLFIFSIFSLASLSGLIPAIKMLTNDATRSGFSEYLSLIFSDGGSVVSHFKEFILSLAEALPIVSITLSLTLILVFFLSAKYAMKQFTRGNTLLSFNT